MENAYKKLHVLSSIILNIVLLIIAFSTSNPMILLCIFSICLMIFLSSGNHKQLKNGIMIFIPFSIITIIINMVFVQQGRIIIFTAFNRNFTLEALIYAIILSFKLLLVIYIFFCLGIMLDSDKAISYFSSIMPKTTLTFMIAFKLFPSMRKRIAILKETYSIRGVDFQGKNIKEKIISYMPIMSILLEDSLEKSFDIGEAAYIRGFLSTKRSIYDKQKFNRQDYLIIITSGVLILFYLILSVTGLENYDSYSYNIKQLLMNTKVLMIVLLLFVIFIELLLFWRKFVVKYEIY